jgi:hypothetical protein
MGSKVISIALLVWSFSIQFSFAQKCEYCFEIEVYQENKKVDIKNNTAFLKRLPFEMHFIMHRPQGIAINACLSDTNMIALIHGKELNEMHPYLYGMAEEMYNPDREILINSNAPSYWFYDDSLTHRFSSVSLSPTQIEGIRYIQQMTNVESGEIIQAKDFPDHLYLGLIACEWIAATQREQEYYRTHLTLVFGQ